MIPSVDMRPFTGILLSGASGRPDFPPAPLDVWIGSKRACGNGTGWPNRRRGGREAHRQAATKVPVLLSSNWTRLVEAPQPVQTSYTAAGITEDGSGPSIVKAQGPANFRFQSTWPSKDIFHEYALDFAKKVNDMTGGELKIEVLPAGAVVPAFQLIDAVSKGTLDGGHGVLVYHYGKQTALALWGSGPGYGMD